VTVSVDQNQGQASAHQVAKYSFGATNISHSYTVLSQPGTTVKNESIGTPGADFTRYASIITTQKNQAGKPLDFSKVEGVWAKSTADAEPQLFSQAALGTGLPIGGLAVPVSALRPEQRSDLLRMFRENDLYRIKFDKVKKERKDGRLLYTYTATIRPTTYALMMKRFSQAIGLHTLDELETTSFASQPDFQLKLTVDVSSRHLVQAETSNGAVKQQYTAYDVPVQVDLPEKTITFEELQKRLGALQ
jgi:hypothetical protein